MNRVALLTAGVALWVGATLLLAELRWFRRIPLAERIAPQVPGTHYRASAGVFSVGSLREVVAPLATDVGNRISAGLGLTEDLGVRLRRIGAPTTATEYRLQQFTAGGVALLGTATLATIASLGTFTAIALSITAAALTYLALEQRVAAASAAWQRRVILELPVIIEQLGMLLSSGHSLTGAITRVAARGHGECATGFSGVVLRISQGVSEIDALREFAAIADVTPLDRLVGVLALNREAADLGALISSEARLVRREVHRDLIETIERRSQAVWIPVTIATLLPGVIFMGVPFLDAVRQLTGS